MNSNNSDHPIPSSPGHDRLLRALRELVPSSFADGQLDWEALRAVIGGDYGRGDHYSFTWAGKEDALRLGQNASFGALHPLCEKSVDWNTTTNVFISGENLEVLKLLYNAYFGRFRLVYIGPPYNSDDDRIYIDDQADHLGQHLKFFTSLTVEALPLKPNPSSDALHHSKWLSMMYPRLTIARQMLREDGFFVVSIDDGEIHHLRLLLNEIFGEENHLATLVWDRSRKNDSKLFSVGHEYMIVYARNAQYLKDADLVLRMPKEGVEEIRALWESLQKELGDDFERVGTHLRQFLRTIPDDDPRGPMKRYKKVDGGGPYRDDADLSWHGGGGPTYDVPHPTTGKPCRVPSRGWVYPTIERMREEIAKGTVVFGDDETTIPSRKSYLFDKAIEVMPSVTYSYSQTASQAFREIFDGELVYAKAKHYKDIQTLVEYLTDKDDWILDFFAGSATTGHAVLESNRHGASRQFVLVQIQEPVDEQSKEGRAAAKLELNTVADIGHDRLRRVIGRLKEGEERNRPRDLGFRIFVLRQSNFLPWPEEPVELDNLDLFVHRTRNGADPLAIIWELALREGYPLSSEIEELRVGNIIIHRVADSEQGRHLFICLDSNVTSDLPELLRMDPHQTLMCADSALTDETATNLALRCRLRTF